MPWRHAVLSKAVTRARNRRRDLIQKVQGEVEAVPGTSAVHEQQRAAGSGGKQRTVVSGD